MNWTKVNKENKARQRQLQQKEDYFMEWLNDGIKAVKMTNKTREIMKTIALTSYKRGRGDKIT